MEIGDIEGTAEALYREAGFDPGERVPPARLARALIPSLKIFVVHSASLPGDAALDFSGPAILVRQGLSKERRSFAILHEVAEWHLARTGYCEPDIEEVADALAAALLAPRQLFLSAVREDGVRFPILARRFGQNQSWAALRVGESTGEPLVLISRQRVRVRGEEWGWPQTEQEIRRLVQKPLPKPLVKVRLSDDSSRIVIRLK